MCVVQERIPPFKLQQHIGKHLLQIALFILLGSSQEGDDQGSIRIAAGEQVDGSLGNSKLESDSILSQSSQYHSVHTTISVLHK